MTFLLSETSNTTKRADLFQKMISQDPSEPTEQERIDGAITKLRYMKFRERESSSAALGFRVDVAKMPNRKLSRDLKKVSTREDVRLVFCEFFKGRQNQQERIVKLLKQIRDRIKTSEFFAEHEVIGSSILLIFDSRKAGVWLIDFAKCTKVPDGMQLDHHSG
ncbi:inositol polyphosphate kinase domain-containing protein [Ditylenchus destructor]|nr:inositol polyphosphate kinase domain-containing protein [Ditylenchus destructor]